MTKTATAKVIGVAAALAVLLAFGATHATQAASKSVRWRAGFDTSVENATLGPENGGGTYYGGVDGVSITSGNSSCGSGNNKTYYSYWDMKIAPTRHVQFTMPSESFHDSFGPEAGPVVPTLPGVDDQLIWPYNLTAFLAYPQPYDGSGGGDAYQYVELYFSTCGCEDRTSTDLIKMPVGSQLKALVKIKVIAHSQACPLEDPSNTDYNLNMTAHGWDTGSGLDVYIQRDSQTQWTAHVDSALDNPDYQNKDYPLLNDFVEGIYTYCFEKTGRRGTTWGWEYIEAAAKAPLKFDLKFTMY